MIGMIALPRWNRLLATIAIVLVLAPVVASRAAQAAAGRIKEFVVPTQSAHPGGIVLGPDGAVWFTEIATNAIGRLAGRTFTTFPLPQGGEPVAIANGPDGALWFVEYSGERI
jgi:streptogramin lyase